MISDDVLVAMIVGIPATLSSLGAIFTIVNAARQQSKDAKENALRLEANLAVSHVNTTKIESVGSTVEAIPALIANVHGMLDGHLTEFKELTVKEAVAQAVEKALAAEREKTQAVTNLAVMQERARALELAVAKAEVPAGFAPTVPVPQ